MKQLDSSISEARLFKVISTLVFFNLALCMLSIFFYTMEFDEIWILTTIKQIVTGHGKTPEFPPVSTTGGLYTLLQSIVCFLFGPNLYAARFISFLSLILLLFLTSRWFKQEFGSSISALIPVVFIVSLPGSLYLSALAYGVVLATALNLLTIYAWLTLPVKSKKRWLVTGALLALTATTRVNFVVTFAAIILWSSGSKENRKKHLFDAIAVSSFAALLGLTIGLTHMMMQADLERGTSILLRSTGFYGGSVWKALSVYTTRWVGADKVAPFSVIGVLTWYAFSPKTNDKQKAFLQILTLSGGLLWGLWIWRSPFPYLRYLWPSMVAFALIFSLLLVKIYHHCEKKQFIEGKIGTLVFLTAILINCSVSNIRNITNGNSSIVGSELMGNAGLKPFQPFKSITDQKQIILYLKENFSDDEKIGTTWNTGPYPYATNKTLLASWQWQKGYASPNKILMHKKTEDINKKTQLWIEKNYTEIDRFNSLILLKKNDLSKQAYPLTSTVNH